MDQWTIIPIFVEIPLGIVLLWILIDIVCQGVPRGRCQLVSRNTQDIHAITTELHIGNLLRVSDRDPI